MRFSLARLCPALPACFLLPAVAPLAAQPAAAPKVGGQVPLAAVPPARVPLTPPRGHGGQG